MPSFRIALGLVALIGGCAKAPLAVEEPADLEEDEPVSTPEEPATTTVPSDAPVYPVEVREAFGGEWVGNGGPEDVCRCVLARLELEVPLEVLAANAVSEEWVTAVTIDCMGPTSAE